MPKKAREVTTDKDAVIALYVWISNVATDAQLDGPVPALDGMTGRELLVRTAHIRWRLET